MPHLLQHHPSGKLPQASKDRSFLQVQLWPSLDSLLAPSDSAKEAVECAGLGPRLCVFQATDKRKALEGTMAFTTQALASVAYQVGNLAGHTLRMLDLQGAALRQVEAKMSTLGQVRMWEGIPLSVLALQSHSNSPTFLHAHLANRTAESWHIPDFGDIYHGCVSVLFLLPH